MIELPSRSRGAQRAAPMPCPADLCYVHDFDRPNRPRLLAVPAGVGRRLRSELERLAGELRTAIAAAVEREEYQERQRAIEKEFEARPADRAREFDARAMEAGVQVVRTPVGLSFVPIRNGQPLTEEQFEALPAADRERFRKAVEELDEHVRETIRSSRPDS